MNKNRNISKKPFSSSTGIILDNIFECMSIFKVEIFLLSVDSECFHDSKHKTRQPFLFCNYRHIYDYRAKTGDCDK